jgi:hypothetical protein
VRSSCAILALSNAESSLASPAELNITGIPDDSACTDAFNLAGEWSDRVCIPPTVDPEFGLLRKDALENTVNSVGEGWITCLGGIGMFGTVLVAEKTFHCHHTSSSYLG